MAPVLYDVLVAVKLLSACADEETLFLTAWLLARLQMHVLVSGCSLSVN
jgi:hypothetical protein